ncbi:glycosyltransferase family 2 protein [Lyngbya aestuarii]|uniref:glycosyltransferase family 2 protein n=1 Tax=Lyngbya aestuarii TaxID=118322 RepID=UPI00403D8C83
MKTPVAFLIFNRPDTTEKVFELIRQAQPTKLLVVADGPRTHLPGEVEKCAATRKIIDRVDWDCEVLTNFSEKNLGCKRRVSTGLDWVFSEVEEAIILEDDCLPAPSFFSFCEALLEKYRHDDRIMMIGGSNFQSGQSRTSYSYFFSKHMFIWGWATWRRAWQYYDVEMKTWPEYKELDLIDSYCEDFLDKKYWVNRFDCTFDGSINSWDYQWIYACWCQNGLSIVPNSNLISNIGFGVDATHTFDTNSLAGLPLTNISDIKHPPFVTSHRLADQYYFDTYLGGKSGKRKLLRIKQEIISLLIIIFEKFIIIFNSKTSLIFAKKLLINKS